MHAPRPQPQIDALREYLARTAPFRGEREEKKSGLESLDAFLGGGLPKGAITVLGGVAGAGRMSLAARIAAEETKAGRPVAWIDGKGTLYPPALAATGVVLHRMLMVQSSDERVVYAAEQIVGSGAFGVVIASGLDPFLTPNRSRRLQTATEGQRVSLLLLLDPKTTSRFTNAALELRLSRREHGSGFPASGEGAIRVEVKKDRSGAAIGRVLITSSC